MEMPRVSEETVAAVVPIAVYWAYAGVHTALGQSRLMDKYRLNTKDEEDRKNMVSKRAVILNVLMQHLMQLAALAVLAMVTGGRGATAKAAGGSPAAVYLTAAARIAVASVWNGAAYHGVHHMPRGVRYNFSDLFFVTWDHVFGTHMPYAVEERPGGDGLVLKPLPPPKATN
uniref:Fatty acid hydroxylase domain-containing protein n=1 Tax=Aegilops tauschii TaxID=37682 RepID=M8C1G6_AEGTA